MPASARAMKRIRCAITVALDWREEAAFAGAGDPQFIDVKCEEARRTRALLESIIEEELNRA